MDWFARKPRRPGTGFERLVRSRVVVQTIDGKSLRGVLAHDYSDAPSSPSIVLAHVDDLQAVHVEGRVEVRETPVGNDVLVPLANVSAVEVLA